MSYVENCAPGRPSRHGSPLRTPGKSGMTNHLASRMCSGGVERGVSYDGGRLGHDAREEAREGPERIAT
jgi:hypothetical protein